MALLIFLAVHMPVQHARSSRSGRGRTMLRRNETASLRLAIATAWEGGAKFECALTLWCVSANAFATAVGGGQLVVLGTTAASAECVEARYLLPARAAEAVRAYHVAREGAGKFVNVLKVALFGMDEFDGMPSHARFEPSPRCAHRTKGDAREHARMEHARMEHARMEHSSHSLTLATPKSQYTLTHRCPPTRSCACGAPHDARSGAVHRSRRRSRSVGLLAGWRGACRGRADLAGALACQHRQLRTIARRAGRVTRSRFTRLDRRPSDKTVRLAPPRSAALAAHQSDLHDYEWLQSMRPTDEPRHGCCHARRRLRSEREGGTGGGEGASQPDGGTYASDVAVRVSGH